MSWRAYFASYTIQSPIHIGYHTISHAERTRYYVPANNMTGAFLASIAAGQDHPGLKTDEKIREAFLFSTFFVSKNGIDPLFPVLTETGDLYYGKEHMSVWDFTNQFISTKEAQKYGIETHTNELEFIVPRNNISEKQNYLVGYVFASEAAEEKGLETWMRSLRYLSVGEEIGHCLGSIELEKLEQLSGEEGRMPFFSLDGVFLDWSGDKVQAIYRNAGPLLGYLQADAEGSLISIYGVKESLEGGFDLLRNVPINTGVKQCWVPGTLIRPGSKGAYFNFGTNGIWALGEPGEKL